MAQNEYDPGATDKKLAEIYANITRLMNTDAMLQAVLIGRACPNYTTPELIEGVKSKILTLSRN